MPIRKLIVVVSLLLFASLAMPPRAAADWLLTPFFGWSGGVSADFGDVLGPDIDFERRTHYGASLAWMGGGIIGYEIDFGYSPDFFEDSIDLAPADSNVTTLMVNLIVGVPIGGQSGPGIRPYGLAGFGMIKSRIGDAGDFFNIDSTDWGFSAGGGIAAFFSDHVGIRGDVRYFRSLEDVEISDFDFRLADLRFWRGSVGVTFRF
ncbi:MAG TPA: porin family protein [Vicinamibacterales bacterium]|nr:porin family protein [Vicinamibacterales bacterium]